MSGQGYEQLTLFPGDSPVSLFPWLESKKEKGMIVTCGPKCCALSKSCVRIASSVKTFLVSSRLPPGRWSRIWSTADITSSCSILKLRLSELGTEEAGCSLWPSPAARDYKGANSMQHLTQPQQPKNKHHTGQLANAVKLYTTPCAADSKGSTGGGNHRSLRTEINGQLNPTWVEWLMGFPTGWTDLNA